MWWQKKKFLCPRVFGLHVAAKCIEVSFNSTYASEAGQPYNNTSADENKSN